MESKALCEIPVSAAFTTLFLQVPKIDTITASRTERSTLKLNICAGPVVALKLKTEVSQEQHVFPGKSSPLWAVPLHHHHSFHAPH